MAKKIRINTVLWFAANAVDMSLDAYRTRKEAREHVHDADQSNEPFTYVAKVRCIEINGKKRRGE